MSASTFLPPTSRVEWVETFQKVGAPKHVVQNMKWSFHLSAVSLKVDMWSAKVFSLPQSFLLPWSESTYLDLFEYVRLYLFFSVWHSHVRGILDTILFFFFTICKFLCFDPIWSVSEMDQYTCAFVWQSPGPSRKQAIPSRLFLIISMILHSTISFVFVSLGLHSTF